MGLYIGVNAFLQSFDQKNWVKTEAKVVQSDSQIHSRADRPDSSSFNFAYEYSFKEKQYTSSAYSAKHVFVKNRKPVEKFSKGENITVYVNPKNPNQAFVELMYPGFTTYVFTIGSVLALLGSYLLSFKPVY
ncbi:MAG: DUF3592 domain-containing protein [Leptospira sp.]|nr:DUF3592 domain-containing protein [Leptospira sp.]